MRIGATRPTVEALLARIDALARERQQLRGQQAARRVLERNRLALVQAQWELSLALIDQHLPAAARDAA